MKKAEKLNRLTRQYARKFRREIEDLEQFSSHTTNLTGMSNFGGFIDYFLDGIFDIFIQQKINRALATTERKAGQLREKLGTLKGYADSVESEIQKKQEERKQIIQEA